MANRVGPWHLLAGQFCVDLRRLVQLVAKKETIRSLKPVTFMNGVIDAASLHRHAHDEAAVGDNRLSGAAGGADDWIEPHPSRRRR